jgi:hypothetical protein
MVVAVPLVFGLAALGQKGSAAVVGVMAALGYALWLRLEVRRELSRPLIADLEGRSAKDESAERSGRRIRVHNRSAGRTIRSVRVELIEFTPPGTDFLPVELKPMNGGHQPFDLLPGAEAYLELVSRSAGSDQFVLGYDMSRVEAGASNLVRAEPLDFVVRVSADAVAPEQYLFSAAADQRGRLHLVATTAPARLAPDQALNSESQLGSTSTPEKSPAVEALSWLKEGSAWGRWQRAVRRKLNDQVGNSAGFSEENLLYVATSVIDDAARTDKIKLWGLSAGKAEFELIDSAIWQTRARLRLERDQQQRWQVRLGGYESLAVDMAELKRLWPEYELLTDDLTRGLNQEWRRRQR